MPGVRPMSGKWFANRGQAIQTIAAITSACVAVAAFVLRNNNYVPKASFVMYVSGGAFLLLAGILIGRRSRSAPPSSGLPASSAETWHGGNTTAAGGNATATGGNVSVYVHPTGAAMVTPPPPAAKDLPKPNLICASSKNVTVERSVGDTWVENIDGALPAVVAVISNRATEGDVAIAREVKAQMIFYNDEGGECFHGTGAWLGLFRNVADFSPGASQKLLLALDNDPHSIAAISNTNERPLPRSARAQIRALESSRQTVEVLALPVLCDVTLLATSGAVLGNFAMQICRKGNALSCTPTEALE